MAKKFKKRYFSSSSKQQNADKLQWHAMACYFTAITLVKNFKPSKSSANKGKEKADLPTIMWNVKL